MTDIGGPVAAGARAPERDTRRQAAALWPFAAAVLLVLGYTMPFWMMDVEGARSSGLDFSADVAASWPMLGAAALVVVGAADRLRGAVGGLAFAAGPLLQWSCLLVLLVATTEDLRSIGSPVSYGAGAVIWMVALVPAIVTAVLAVVEATHTGPPPLPSGRRTSPEIGLAVALGGAAWIGAHVLPGDTGQSLLSGPLLADVARLGWVAGVGGAVFLAATRRTQGSLALVVGVAATWSLWWVDAGGAETLASVFEPWSVDVLFGLGATVAGTAAAVGLVGLQLDAARTAPAEARPPISFGGLVSVILVPLAGVVGFLT